MPNPSFDYGGRSGPRSRQTSKMRLVVPWLVALGVVGACAGCFGWQALKPPGERWGDTDRPDLVREQNWKLIRMGMTFKEVQNLLGPTTRWAIINDNGQVKIRQTIYTDCPDIEPVRAAKGRFVSWLAEGATVKTVIWVRLDKDGMPPSPDAKVVGKGFYERTPDKFVYRVDDGGGEHEMRLPR